MTMLWKSFFAAYEMTDKKFRDLIGQRCKHCALGAHGEIVDVRKIYDEDVVCIEWDNGANRCYNEEEFEAFIELTKLRTSM
jgi:hypothetical protein